MKDEEVKKLAKKIVLELRPYCRRVKIVGSIRRGEKVAKDIDVVLIPKNLEKLEGFMETKGKALQKGEHESTWKISGVQVELYYTNENEWGAELLAYSSEKGSAIGLRMIAKKKGYKLNNHGLWKGDKKIAGKTEREIYKELGRNYKSPRER
jgi:DNA polymerase (family 10)